MESMWQNMGANSSSKTMIGDIIVINSIVMTTCMSPFSNPLLDFNLMSKFSTFTNKHFCKYYSCISIWCDLIFKMIMVKVALSNKSQCKYA
jgi:hypothetical protein